MIVAGTPEKVAATAGSATGEYLDRVLRGEPLIPLADVSFAEAAGRTNGKKPRPQMSDEVERTASAVSR